MPLGCSDDELPWARHADTALDTKYPYVCHAEMNAILNKNSADVKSCTIYATMFPCNECAKLIIQSGSLTCRILDAIFPRHTRTAAICWFPYFCLCDRHKESGVHERQVSQRGALYCIATLAHDGRRGARAILAEEQHDYNLIQSSLRQERHSHKEHTKTCASARHHLMNCHARKIFVTCKLKAGSLSLINKSQKVDWNCKRLRRSICEQHGADW